MPEFSFVIPVYNGGAYIESCVGSILRQTHRDLEVICVDDASTDNSLEILRSLAAGDSRVRILEHGENRGSARARRWGVLQSKGAYVLFADQDDVYLPFACERLHELLQEDLVSILNYRAQVCNEGGVSQAEINWLQNWLNPHEGKLFGPEILSTCFVDLGFSYSIWNKAYEGDMARRAFSEMEDVFIPLGEDNYASFVLLSFAQTYKGVNDTLYRYRYGRGYTGTGTQTPEEFQRTCGLRVAADLIERFVERRESQGGTGALADELSATIPEPSSLCEVYRAARKHLLRYTFDRLREELSESQQSEALKYIFQAWPYQEVCSYVADERPDELLEVLNELLEMTEEKLQKAPEAFQCAYAQLADSTKEIQAHKESLEKLRHSYEASRAYRVGRALTSPIRVLKH